MEKLRALQRQGMLVAEPPVVARGLAMLLWAPLMAEGEEIVKELVSILGGLAAASLTLVDLYMEAVARGDAEIVIGIEIIQIETAKAARHRPVAEELRSIPTDRPSRLPGRFSGDVQIKESLQSIAEFGVLVRLAWEDGFRTELSDEVARRLDAIRRGEPGASRYWVDGQLIVDLRDLGLSGRLGPEKRSGLAEFRADLSRGERPDVTGTVYLSSEGVSRLWRDQDRLVGYQLLKLMKEANCRVRTPFGVLNPRVDRDWRELAEGFEEAARESKRLQEKHFGPKILAKAGKHVGGPVPPGFIVEIEGRKSRGSYMFGKWQPYPPHIEITIKVLKEYVRQGGSKYR